MKSDLSIMNSIPVVQGLGGPGITPAMIQRFIHFYQKPVQVEAFDSGALARECATSCGGLTCDIAYMPVLRADRECLRLVLQSLCDAALARGARQMRFDASHGQHAWVFLVEDDGAGIHPKDHEAIFRLHPRPQTMEGDPGVALALAYRIISLYGGEMGVHSDLGESTMFYFTWPDSAG